MINQINFRFNQEQIDKKGITFIELLVSVAVLGGLVLLASPDVLGNQERARVMAIRNDIMLAEGKVGEYRLLYPAKFSTWSLVEYAELQRAREDEVLYDVDGKTKEVPHVLYKVLSDAFVGQRVPSQLPGVFFMTEQGDVFYADVDADYHFAEHIPPRIVTPEMEIREGGGWVYGDFAYDAHRIIGLTRDGEERLDSGQDNLILPDVNPLTGDTITTVERNALRHYQFQGDLEGDTIEEIEDSAFRGGEFSGDFIMPNIQHIDSNSFRQSHFTGDFIAPDLAVIETFAFHDSVFTGEFYAPSIEYIGTDAFRLSNFKGTFEKPRLIFIDGDAFRHSTFSGSFYAPIIETIGQNAFMNSRFSNGQFGNSLPPSE